MPGGFIPHQSIPAWVAAPEGAPVGGVRCGGLSKSNMSSKDSVASISLSKDYLSRGFDILSQSRSHSVLEGKIDFSAKECFQLIAEVKKP